MLARVQPGVEQRPQLGPLRLGLPLTEAVAVRKNAFLGTGLLFVAPRAADQRVKAEFFNRFQQRDRLVHVAAFARVRQAHRAALHRILDIANDQLGAQFLRTEVAEIGDFREVVPGVDHQQRVGDTPATGGAILATGGAVPAPEGLLGALQNDQRILPARKQQRRPLERGRHLAQDEDGFFFQRVQVRVAQVVAGRLAVQGVVGVGAQGIEHDGFSARVHVRAPVARSP